MKTRRHIPFFLSALLAGIVLLHGCAADNSSRSRGSAGSVHDGLPALSKRFSNIPIPKKYDLDRDKSFIYESGSGRVKVGRLHLTGWGGPENVIMFYRNQMVKKGWNLIRVTEQETTVLLYEQNDQICTVVIVKSFGKTSIDIQFGPK